MGRRIKNHPKWRWKDAKQDIQGIKQDIGDSKQDIQGIKQDIGDSKQDIQEMKQDIGIPNALSSKTKQHIRDLFCEFGYARFFGRTGVQNILGLTAAPSSALLKRMLELDLIYLMKGKGKGKYLFKNTEDK